MHPHAKYARVRRQPCHVTRHGRTHAGKKKTYASRSTIPILPAHTGGHAPPDDVEVSRPAERRPLLTLPRTMGRQRVAARDRQRKRRKLRRERRGGTGDGGGERPRAAAASDSAAAVPAADAAGAKGGPPRQGAGGAHPPGRPLGRDLPPKVPGLGPASGTCAKI